MNRCAVSGMSVVLAAGLLVVGCGGEGSASRSGAKRPPASTATTPSDWARGYELRDESERLRVENLERLENNFVGMISGSESEPSAPFSPTGDPNPIVGDAAVGFDPAMDTDETWIIARDGQHGQFNPVDDVCSGLMYTIPAGQTIPVPMPLKHTDVQATITGPMSCVRVEQQFHNPYDGKIEATYVFPLPEDAAVNEFLMVIGDRQIRGIIREREEAERIYAEARSQGYVASLLTEERANIFTQKVANIEPGKEIDIAITYYGLLDYVDNGFEFVFPMVVGPRYNAAGSTDGVGSVGRGQQGASGQATEVAYLRPEERSGHDISLSVEIDAGVEIEKIASTSHVIEVSRAGESRARVSLAALDNVPNKDFVLRVEVAGDEVKSGVLAHRDEKGGYFSMLIVPPRSLENLARGPVEMVYVLDSSGSMSGRPMEQAKGAITRSLRSLQAGDTFQIINFFNSASALGAYPVEANPGNVQRGVRYLDQIEAGGGTEMILGIKAALEFPHDPERLRFVVFATDGFIGNEREILGAMHQRLGGSRVFSFGVGSSPNRFLMDAMATMGQGFVNYLGLNDSAPEVMDTFMEKVSHAAMHDVRLDFGGARVSEVYPARLPDVFVGRPVMIVGRFEGELPGNVRIRGRAGGEDVVYDAPVSMVGSELAGRAMAPVWARAKITEISQRAMWDGEINAAAEIRRVALDHCLMSAFTAFVAVDSSERTAGEYGTSVPVAVPVPEGVRYDTTVQDGRGG